MAKDDVSKKLKESGIEPIAFVPISEMMDKDVEPDVIITQDDAKAMAKAQCLEDQKAEASRRIMAVAYIATQQNMTANRPIMSEAKQELHDKFLKWVKATLQARRKMPVVLEPVHTEYFDFVEMRDPKESDAGEPGQIWFNQRNDKMFENRFDDLLKEVDGDDYQTWHETDFLLLNAERVANDDYWPECPQDVIDFAKSY